MLCRHWIFILLRVHIGYAWFRNAALHTFIHSPENYYCLLSSPDPLVPWPTQIVSAALLCWAAIKQACQSKVLGFPETPWFMHTESRNADTLLLDTAGHISWSKPYREHPSCSHTGIVFHWFQLLMSRKQHWFWHES